MPFVFAINETLVPEGQAKKLLLNDKEVAIVRVKGEILAFDDICSHEYCSLSDGEIIENRITCPCHGSQFDMHSGEVLNLPASMPIKVYETKIENGEIWVNV